MLNKDGNLPNNNIDIPTNDFEGYSFSKTFPAVIPQDKLESYGNNNLPPYSMGADKLMYVKQDTIPQTDINMPVFSTKITINPLPNINPNADISYTAELINDDGMNKKSQYHKKSIMHIIPTANNNNSQIEDNSQYVVLKNLSTEQSNTLTVLPEIPNSLVHTYKSENALDTSLVSTRLIENTRVKTLDNSDEPVLDSNIIDVKYKAKSATIPKNRKIGVEDETDTNNKSIINRSMTFASTAIGKLLNSKQVENQQQLLAAQNQLLNQNSNTFQSSSSIYETKPIAGFSKVIQELDEQKNNNNPSVYNFIIKDEYMENEKQKANKLIKKNNSKNLQQKLSEFITTGKFSKITNILGSQTFEKPSSSSLSFQYSDSLIGFLDDNKQQGLIWEDKSSTDSNESFEAEDDSNKLRPAIIYNGTTNEPPVFAGSLKSTSMILHACEFHQYMQISNVEDPAFLQIANPQSDPIHGKVILPFDPSYTGMPAPKLQDVLLDKTNLIKITPIVKEWFQPNIPVQDKGVKANI